jgi:DNA-binding NarL/FixJ family response regulator
MKSSPKQIIRVSVLQSDPVRLLGLSTIFSSESGIQLRSASMASVLLDQQTDIVLLTVNRGAAFHAAMSAMKAMCPGIRIIVSGPGNRDEDVLRAVQAGAKGYVSEEAPAEEFNSAIREVYRGSVWLPGHVLSIFIERSTSVPRSVQHGDDIQISEREREVLRLLISGCSNREIASELGIIERTVKAHVTQLLRKFGVQNRIALSVHAVTHSAVSTRQ